MAKCNLCEAAPDLLEAAKQAIPRLAELDKMLNPKLFAKDGSPLALDNTAGRVLSLLEAAIAKAENKR